MSQAEEQVHQPGPGAVVVRRDHSPPADEWADLRWVLRSVQRGRPILICAILMVGVQVAWRAQFLGRMYFYRQDFFNLDLAISSPFSWRYLTYVGTGHVMIGQRALIWLLARISLYNWGLASAITLVFLAAAGLSGFMVLRTLFGERAAILIPLGIYLFTPLGVPYLGWWTVALESVPLQLALFTALNSHIHYVRTRSTRSLVAAVAWVACGMLFFEKGMVVPVVLFAVTAAFLADGRSWLAGMMQVLSRYRRAWLLYAAVLGGYAGVLAVSLPTATVQPQVPASTASVLTFSWGLLKSSLLPGAIGGPWKWWPLPGDWYALAAPPAELVWLAFIVAAAVVGVSVLRRRMSWRAWAIFAAWVVLADMAPVIIGRLHWYPSLLALDTHYVADAMPVLVICIGLAFLPVSEQAEAAQIPAVSAGGVWARSRQNGSDQAWRAAVAGVLAVFVVGSVWSTLSYQSKMTGDPAESYIANAIAAAEVAPRGTLVLNSAVPDQIKDSNNDARAVISPISPRDLTWIQHPNGTIDGLRIFGSDGRLHMVWVYGASSGPARNSRGCWPERHGQIVIRFFQNSPNLSTVLRIGYIWNSAVPGVVNVQYGTTIQEMTVKPGLHSGFLTVTGSANSITVSGLGYTRMCVGDAEAGLPGPALSGPVLPTSP